MNYIAYYRVSTEKQGETGLGLQAQRDSVLAYIEKNGGALIEEFTDIESGSKVDRINLNIAIERAVETGATILVKKLDRLSRDGFKITTLLDELGIVYLDVESPYDTELLKNIKMALAKDEREKISERTQSALDQIKKKLDTYGQYTTRKGKVISSLGNPETLGGKKAIENSVATRKRKALTNPANKQATAVIVMMKQEGKTFAEITRFLNTNGFKTSKGNLFSQVQVTKLFNRATNSISSPVVSDSY